MIDIGLILVLLCFAAVVIFVGALISAIGDNLDGWKEHPTWAGAVAGVLGTLLVLIVLALAFAVGTLA